MTKLVLQGYNVTSKARHGALVGKIGDKGEVKTDVSGRLCLGWNDNELKNNSGHYVAKVFVR